MDLKKVKLISFVMLGIFALLMLGMILTTGLLFGYLALGTMAVYGIFLIIFWRCPKCGKNLGSLWVKHCPNCGEKVF